MCNFFILILVFHSSFHHNSAFRPGFACSLSVSMHYLLVTSLLGILIMPHLTTSAALPVAPSNRRDSIWPISASVETIPSSGVNEDSIRSKLFQRPSFKFPRAVHGSMGDPDEFIEPLVSVSEVEVVNPRNRSKRSLQHVIESAKERYMSLQTINREGLAVYMEILDDGTVRGALNAEKNAISFISKESVHVDILAFLPHDTTVSVEDALRDLRINGSDVIIRRYKTNMYVAMNELGQIYTERMQNYTVTTDAVWKIEITAYGMIFSHAHYPSSLNQGQNYNWNRHPWLLAVSDTNSIVRGNWSMTGIYWNLSPAVIRHPSKTPGLKGHHLYVGRNPLRRVLPASRENLENRIKSLRTSVCRAVHYEVRAEVIRDLHRLLTVLNKLSSAIRSLVYTLKLAPNRWSLDRRNSLVGHFKQWISLLCEKHCLNLKRKFNIKLCPPKSFTQYGRVIRRRIDQEIGKIFLELQPIVEIPPSEKYNFLLKSDIYYLLRYKLHMRIPSIKAIKRASFYFYRYYGKHADVLANRSVPELSSPILNSMILKKINEYLASPLKRPSSLKSILTLKNLRMCQVSSIE